LIRALMASVADTVLFPVQDILGLGSEARMNTPAVASGNWRWRMQPGALTPELAGRLQELTKLFER
jgi:4-alpha-glucanotransferase